MQLGVVESRFADIVWQNAPLATKDLIALCAKELNWKRTTTYTVLKKLCLRGLFDMTDAKVTVLMTKDEFDAISSQQFVDNTFDGSLPAFLAAFSTRQTLSKEEVAEIRKMIDAMEET
jgi:predicted transcriptional regulator